MSFNVTNFTQSRLEVQLTFDEPLLVSANRDLLDEIEIEISKLFLIPIRSVLLPNLPSEYVELKEKLPLMVRSQVEMERLLRLKTSVRATSVIVVVIPFFAQFFLKGVMKRLWAFFHSMQLIESFSYMSLVGLSINA